ncbi:epsin-2 isoform X10 [Macaca fascicularis]|uniref:epsin-2 isoform X10 n=1 Tax=Macaca fascicularis TaxID=9541 RepID=UPI003D15D0AA
MLAGVWVSNGARRGGGGGSAGSGRSRLPSAAGGRSGAPTPARRSRAPEASLCPQHRTGAPLGQSEELQPLSQRHPFLPHLGLASRPNGDWSQPCLTCDRAARATSPRVSSELEQARPQTSGEEELQLQLALAMSREVAEQEERLRRGDDLRLQMALEESRRDTVKIPKKKEQTTLLDLMDALPSSGLPAQKAEPWGPSASTNQTNPWGRPAAPASASDPWPSFGTKPAASVDPWGVPAGASTQSVPKNSDPWAASQQLASSAGKTASDAWGAVSSTKPVSASGSFELFSNLNGTIKDDFSEFDNLRTSKRTAESVTSLPSQNNGTTSPDPFESQPLTVASSKPSSARKTPESFLGPNAALVNLDSLVTRPAPPAQSLNPFLAPGAPATSAPVNPFQVNQPQPLTLNQLRGSPVLGTSTSFGPGPGVESMAVASMTSTAPHPALGATGSSLTPLGPATMNMVGSVGIPPSAAQATGTTNPFLL